MTGSTVVNVSPLPSQSLLPVTCEPQADETVQTKHSKSLTYSSYRQAKATKSVSSLIHDPDRLSLIRFCPPPFSDSAGNLLQGFVPAAASH